MPTTPQDDEPPEGTYSLADLEAMAAAGDIELAMPGTPEYAAGVRALREQLARHDAALLARDGPDALTSDRDLRIAALAAERDPAYVAHALAASRERIGADREGLAQWLGIAPDRLAALAIQPRPDPAAPTFTDQVRELADRYGAQPDRLADALG